MQYNYRCPLLQYPPSWSLHLQSTPLTTSAPGNKPLTGLRRDSTRGGTLYLHIIHSVNVDTRGCKCERSTQFLIIHLCYNCNCTSSKLRVTFNCIFELVSGILWIKLHHLRTACETNFLAKPTLAHTQYGTGGTSEGRTVSGLCPGDM